MNNPEKHFPFKAGHIGAKIYGDGSVHLNIHNQENGSVSVRFHRTQIEQLIESLRAAERLAGPETIG